MSGAPKGFIVGATLRVWSKKKIVECHVSFEQCDHHNVDRTPCKQLRNCISGDEFTILHKRVEIDEIYLLLPRIAAEAHSCTCSYTKTMYQLYTNPARILL